MLKRQNAWLLCRPDNLPLNPHQQTGIHSKTQTKTGGGGDWIGLGSKLAEQVVK